ncbi:MAG: mechanosensitive ion channel family protein [Spirochaetaceae bacterium]|jgi:small-conductance mechanosensitive channel|nr:mechanosensitive ion channel family protein [Spirochaetaceae bacterium]
MKIHHVIFFLLIVSVTVQSVFADDSEARGIEQAGTGHDEDSGAEQTDNLESGIIQSIEENAKSETAIVEGAASTAAGAGKNLIEAVGSFSNSAVSSGVEKATQDFPVFLKLGMTLTIFGLQILLIWIVFHFSKILKKKVQFFGGKKFKNVHFKSIVLLESKQIVAVFCFTINVLKYVLAVFQLIITIPIIFNLFEPTKNIASKLFGYIFTPIKNFAIGFISYIPNLFTIIVIIFIAHYTLRALRFFTHHIEKGKLIIPGFYAEWALPTFNILRVLLIAFTVAMVYPHLPNSESDVFKGVSVLVGILFSLGSSSIVGNLISGIVMTYMRPFQLGDRIKINDITGFVIERGPMVVRIRTHKNEIVSMPNQMVMNNFITNYSTPASPASEELNGLIVHCPVSVGYDIPWERVHEILLKAAGKTENTEKTPVPFINHLKLDDFYCLYELNVYTKEVNILPKIYTNLYRNIQSEFAENNISLNCPHLHIEKNVSEF